MAVCKQCANIGMWECRERNVNGCNSLADAMVSDMNIITVCSLLGCCRLLEAAIVAAVVAATVLVVVLQW